MKALNYSDRRKQKIRFFISFICVSIILFLCTFITLIIAEKGVGLIEKKQADYNAIFQKQAELNFKTEDLFKKLYSLKNKRRSVGEYKQMQKIITNIRVELQESIDTTKQENHYYKVYNQFFSEVRSIQSLLDYYDKEVNLREANKEQLEKCREKYQDINKIEKSKD